MALHRGKTNQAANISIVDRLTGHTTPGETARYTKSSNLKHLQATIDAVDIGVTFDNLYIDNLDAI
jgi:hypothetical protein